MQISYYDTILYEIFRTDIDCHNIIVIVNILSAPTWANASTKNMNKNQKGSTLWKTMTNFGDTKYKNGKVTGNISATSIDIYLQVEYRQNNR